MDGNGGKESRTESATKLMDRAWFRWLTVAATFLTFIGFFISIPPVQEKFFGKRIDVALELISEIPVFDVRQPLEGLRIEFNNQDLTALKKNLLAVRIQLRNAGDVSITPSRMTAADPIGFKVISGEIVQITNTNFTSDHLQRLAKPSLRENSLLVDPNVIFDPNDAIRFDLIILRDSEGSLEYAPLGKIEGIQRIQFVDVRSLDVHESFSSLAFKGNLWIQFARLGAYTVAAIVLLTVGYGAISFLIGIPERRRRKRRRRISKSIYGILNEAPSSLRLIIQTIYESYGWEYLSRLLSFLKRLNSSEKWGRFRGTIFEVRTNTMPKWESAYEYVSRTIDQDYLSIEDVFRILEALGFVSVKERRIDEALIAALERTVEALEQHAKLDGAVRDFDSRRPLPYLEQGENFERPSRTESRIDD